jgi:hypothetical protein
MYNLTYNFFKNLKIMKKKYLKPVVEVYEMQLQGALLAASSDPTKEYHLEKDNFEGELG